MLTRLDVKALALRRGGRILFRDLSLSLQGGAALTLVGSNGAGKTSLLRAIAGFIAPEAGEIDFSGSDGRLDADLARRANIHWLGHQDGLKGERTAREELAFQTRWFGGRSFEAAAERLNLRPLLDLEVRRLSAGQRRRLALARLVAAPRSLWLLDEPMAPLDADHRALFGEIMAGHLAGGGLILAAVHDPLPVAATAVRVGA
jgi:heme exporter protein A